MNLFRTFVLAATATAMMAQPASAQTKWNLPAAYPPDNPHSENLALFAKDVAAATDNKLQGISCSLPRTWKKRPVAR